MTVIDLNNDSMPRSFKPVSFEVIDDKGRRSLKGQLINFVKGESADVIEVKWNLNERYWEIPKRTKTTKKKTKKAA